jgi:hypothetical protein
MTLLSCPGITKIATLDAAPRAQQEFNGRLFVVGGTKFYEIILSSLAIPGVPTIPIVVSTNVLNPSLPIANDGLPASIAVNENQILIASGGSVYIYYLNAMTDSVSGASIAAGTFAQVAASNFTLASGNAPVKQVAFCDSFFLALIANSQNVQVSNVLDGANWVPGGARVGTPPVYTGGVSTQIVVSVFPDNVIGMIVDHRTLWMLGRKKMAAYVSGDPVNIFAIQPGGLIEQGAVATFAISQIDNSIFWVSGDDKGDGMGFRLNGLTPQRITTHAIETAWKAYPNRSNAVSYTWQNAGHSFWRVLFPSANKGNGATWEYDVATGLWHECDFLNVTSGASMGHPSWNHAYWNGAHIVGDWRSANLYQMDDGFYDNAGVPLVRVRRAPHISTELEMVRYDRFILDVETGVAAAGQAAIVLQSANGNLWQLSVNDAGLLTTTQVSGLAVSAAIKLNDSALATTWQLGVTNVGLLTMTSIVRDITQPTIFPILSATKLSIWNLGVLSSGLMTTTQAIGGSIPTLNINPLVFLRFSDDGGRTWSNGYERNMGLVGQFRQRVQWHRLGASRIRTIEISCSEAIPFRIVDAYINAAPGFQPSERMVHQMRKVA